LAESLQLGAGRASCLAAEELLGARTERPPLLRSDKHVGAPIVGWNGSARREDQAFKAIEHRHEFGRRGCTRVCDNRLCAGHSVEPAIRQRELAKESGCSGATQRQKNSSKIFRGALERVAEMLGHSPRCKRRCFQWRRGGLLRADGSALAEGWGGLGSVTRGARIR